MSTPILTFPAPWFAEKVSMPNGARVATLSARGVVMTHVEAVSAHNALHAFTLRLCRELKMIDFDCACPHDDILAEAVEYLEAHK